MNTESGNVKIISKEMIKPSSATPLNLRNLKLSFLDQLVPPFYVPVIFFYKPNSDHHHHRAQLSQQLKQSFSESLTLFYPLAGRLDADTFSVDCNDAGAEFIEARVHSLLSAAVEDPRMEELEKYLPADPKTLISASADAPPLPLLSVQVNFFDCGGIAIGVCSSHQVTDAASLVAFLGSWAATNRGEKKSPPPSFHLARHFPARDVSAAGFSSSVYRKKETLVTKRFIFDKEKLSALKQLAATSPPPPSETTVGIDDPTRVEVVSAFIWKHFIEMSAAKNPNTISALWHVVNLRARIKTRQQIPENVVGNCILKKFFISDDGTDQNSFHDLVRKLRTGIREIDEEYISELAADIKGDDGKNNNYLKDISKSFDLVVNGEMEACGFSSWCRFPVYEVDYGWGTPEWVCPTSCPEKNVTFLMSSKDGDGVEAWMNILESTVEILDSKFKLIGTSPN